MAHPLWPLFDLRVRTERLELRLPTDDEIAELMIVARTGIHEPDEMPFAAPWTKKPSPRFEREFAQWHWFNRATWTPEKWGLLFAIFLEGRPIGAQDLNGTDFAHTRAVLTGSWLGMGWQGRGFGKEMRAAVLGFAFDYLGADVAETEAYLDNARSARVSTSLGYAPNGIGRHAPEGLPRDTQRFRMTAEMWHSRPRPTLEVDGFEACRDLFGLAEDTTET